MYRGLQEFLDKHKIVHHKEVNLSNYSYAKTGGQAACIVSPQSLDLLKLCLQYFAETNLSFRVIGATSNILFRDEKSYGVFLTVENLNDIKYDRRSSAITVFAGAMLTDFVHYVVDRSVAGFENLVGIPGTVGGAIYMNAGSFRCEIKDHLKHVMVMRYDGSLVKMKLEDLDMSWRHSIFMDKNLGVIVSATFHRQEGNYEKINEEMNRWQKWRDTHLESVYPNLGSIFATKDIYAHIAENHRVYKILLWLVRKYFSGNMNPKNNSRLAKLTASYFGLSKKKMPYSDYTLNTFVNDNMGSERIIEYMEVLKRLTGGNLRMENEIIEGPIWEKVR